jgi:DNA-binding transcriptional LysR family regulator
LISDDAQSLVTAAIAGVGIVMCSDWLAASERASGRLVTLLADWSIEGEGSIHLVRPSTRFTPARTRRFSDWIVGKLKRPPWMSN